MLYIVSFVLAQHFLALFMQTFFHHRYSAHKMFTMNKFWEGFFYTPKGIKRKIEIKGAPKAIKRAMGFSISNFNITRILLSTH